MKERSAAESEMMMRFYERKMLYEARE